MQSALLISKCVSYDDMLVCSHGECFTSFVHGYPFEGFWRGGCVLDLRAWYQDILFREGLYDLDTHNYSSLRCYLHKIVTLFQTLWVLIKFLTFVLSLLEHIFATIRSPVSAMDGHLLTTSH